MEQLLYFFVHYGVLAVVVLLATRAPLRSRAGLAVAAVLGLAICLLLYLWGQWPLVGSYYARYLPPAVAILVAGRAVRAWPQTPRLFPASLSGKLAFVLNVVVAVLTIRLVAGAIAGLSFVDVPRDLAFPLKGGTYYVASGGSSKVLNGHMRSRPTAQQFALDINKLGALGGASHNILSVENDRHHIFGEPVFAPCEGEVTWSANDVADNRGSSMDVSVEDGSGNHVTIDCDGLVVSMLHLKRGSVVVGEGQHLSPGDLVGQVGNSGFSQEPHLHIQASVKNADGRQVGVPISFGRASPVRNSLIRAGG
jgi:hypothetical protein